MSKTTSPAQEALERSRRRAEQRLAVVQQAVQREIGWAPKGRAWLIPLIGFAAGLGAAALVGGKRRSKRVN